MVANNSLAHGYQGGDVMFSHLPLWAKVIIKIISLGGLVWLAIVVTRRCYPRNVPTRQDLIDKDIHPTIRKKK